MFGRQSTSSVFGRGTAELKLQAAAIRLSLALKAGYRPQQPRVPRGNVDGGQWTLVPGYARVERVSRRRGGGTIRIAGRSLPVTPAQEARVQISLAAARDAVARTRRIDPRWRPRPQAFETVEGYIRANEAIRLQAELRLFELTGRPLGLGPFGKQWINLAPGQKRLTAAQRRQLDLIGQRFGCHGCGSTTNLTRNGHYVGDHSMPSSLGRPSRIAPHCLSCSNSQGGYVGSFLGRRNR